MKITIKHIGYIFVVCVSFVDHAAYAVDVHGTVTFSFDQLYPSNTISRALNSLRYVWSLAQDLNDNQYDADNVRHVWLELYGACDQLVDQRVTVLPVPQDVAEYIKQVWQLTGVAYDQIQLKDVSLGQFLGHMRIATGQVLERL